MKLCVSSTGPDLDSQVDPRFGRCSYFLIVDTDTLEYGSFGNTAAGASGGAGIQAARFVAEKKAAGVLTGNLGPNATQVLQAAGLKMFTGARNGTVRQAVEDFNKGLYSETGKPSVQSHHGMASDEAAAPLASPESGSYFASGMATGRGMGRGMGGGGGMGKGMGRGMGRRMGGGCGMGMGRSMGAGQGQAMMAQNFYPSPPVENQNFKSATSTGLSRDEVGSLKDQAILMKEQLADIQRRINELSGQAPVAQMDISVAVDEAACTGCGICEQVCPEGAITINEVAEINQNLCKGCGICIDQCPAGALHEVRR
jgi:predicted Fe-Mo cluster-binding NifX family protein/Pyruvate/2-oxoacid:ferredoxin oxidoreductase delta subunit